jgi:hypothetical protein
VFGILNLGGKSLRRQSGFTECVTIDNLHDFWCDFGCSAIEFWSGTGHVVQKSESHSLNSSAARPAVPLDFVFGVTQGQMLPDHLFHCDTQSRHHNLKIRRNEKVSRSVQKVEIDNGNLEEKWN